MYAKCLDNKGLNTFYSCDFFSYSEMWLSKIYFKYLQTGYNSKFGDNFKFTNKKNDKYLVQISSPKSDPYNFLDVALLWQPHPTVAFYRIYLNISICLIK